MSLVHEGILNNDVEGKDEGHGAQEDAVARLLHDPSDPPMAVWMMHMMRTVESFQSKSLSDIVMPGSHNSATHTIRDTSLAAWFGGFLAVTQNVSVYEQLKTFGVRFLDFRVTDEGTSGDLWISHTFLAQPLKPVLEELKRFLDETEEIVILQIKRDHSRTLSKEGLANLRRQLVDLFGNAFEATLSRPLAELVNLGTRLVVLSPFPHLKRHPIFAGSLRTSWTITKSATPSELVSKLSEYMVSQMKHKALHTLDAYITPTWKTALEMKTWRKVGGHTNETVKALLHKLDAGTIQELNIVALDWIESDLCQKLISLNQ